MMSGRRMAQMLAMRCCNRCGRWGTLQFRPCDDGRDGVVCSNDRACRLRLPTLTPLPTRYVGSGDPNNEMRCYHCGKPPESDGDHNCPCPHSDADCPDHFDNRWTDADDAGRRA